MTDLGKGVWGAARAETPQIRPRRKSSKRKRWPTLEAQDFQ
jgi:hypothetical protein